jgi:hypothetical protein
MTTGSETDRVYFVEPCALEEAQCLFQIRFWSRHASGRACHRSIDTACAIWEIATSAKIVRHSASKGYEIRHYKVISRLPNYAESQSY